MTDVSLKHLIAFSGSIVKRAWKSMGRADYAKRRVEAGFLEKIIEQATQRKEAFEFMTFMGMNSLSSDNAAVKELESLHEELRLLGRKLR